MRRNLSGGPAGALFKIDSPRQARLSSTPDSRLSEAERIASRLISQTTRPKKKPKPVTLRRFSWEARA